MKRHGDLVARGMVGGGQASGPESALGTGAPDRRGALRYALYPSPLGGIFIAVGRAGVTDLVIGGGEEAFLERMEERHGAPPSRGRSGFAPVFKGLDRYFSGAPAAFDLAVDLYGTPFEMRVWDVLKSIPYGVARSYGWVAGRAGNRRGARAAGGACGANPVPIIIPCHRVLRADGSIGGYTGGVDIKRALLKIEGIEFSG